ncbi:hypothetical protein LSG23_20595 (plasmid) [Bacillus velezensis]|uniref:hypothetical protein n=2 Tax=Bacillus velezensis TaxID=492670 RepID=UPI000988176F|nr:hypothetical protein [Bacillus velezensis]AQS42483.1 hypothetical protein BVH55_00370 [Bacillus velezensis]WNR83191.1 hypothetical protein RP314_20735 [Bacillus velezensis]
MINQTSNEIDLAINLGKIISKQTPYEVIPRELLQAPEKKEMSLQALGLLLNLKSLPDTWTIVKTNLYHRYPFNKESSIKKAWTELENCNYAKEIKQREGKKYRYHYFFDIVPFDTNSIEISNISGDIGSFIGNKHSSTENASEDNVIKYNNRFEHSYELLPRELLQTQDLSLEAMALLCYLISYPENYEFKKTKLYDSFKKNKRRPVSRMLNELMDKGYFLQFRRREGKKNKYKYIYRHTPFSSKEISELIQVLEKHDFSILQNEHESSLETGKRTVQKKSDDFLETGKRTVQKSPLNQGLLDCSFSGVHFQVSDFECSKSGANIIDKLDNTHKDNTHKDNTHSLNNISLDDDDEKNRYKESETDLREIENQAREFKRLCTDQKLRACAVFLENNKIKFSDIFGVIKGIEEEKIYFNKKTLEQQLKITLDEQRENGMTNFVKYFLTGLKRNSDFIAAQEKRDLTNMTNEEYRKHMLTEKYLEKALGEALDGTSESERVPFYNWLEK